MFEGPNDSLYSAITVCTLVGLSIAGLAYQAWLDSKLRRHWKLRRRGRAPTR